MRGLPSGVSYSLTGLLTAALIGAGLTACGSGSASTADPFPSFTPRPTVVAATPGADGVQQVTIQAAEDLFRPPNITAHPGKIKITVENKDDEFHNITVDVAPAANSGTIKAHTSASVQFTLPRPGKYGFFCSFHQDTGMVGLITVE